MTMTDPIADMLTRIRNACKAKQKKVDIPASKVKLEIARILKNEHYVENFKFIEDGKRGVLRIYLKYTETEESIIKGLKRISKPGLRKYVNKNEIPRVLGGLGLAIITTSTGILSDKEAKKNGVGGEILCYIW